MDSNIILQRLEEVCERMNKMSEKLEMFMQKHTVWSLYEIGLVVDIIKDMSTIEKNYIKSHKLLQESSIERV